jgi:5-(aminomethyl)-3-furanmethanol phosphate kinase
MDNAMPGADGTGFDVLLKVGGSLERGQGLERLCQEIARLGSARRLLVIPGGGIFADQVRSAYRDHHLSETAAHRMALLAMDQYGLLLADRIPGALATADVLSARQAATQGRAAVLLPAALINQADPLPHSWRVTSDSIAAWIAGLVKTGLLVLLKDVDGLYQREDPLAAAGTPEREIDLSMQVEQGGVDAYLVRVLCGLPLQAWAINGNAPERLGELLETGSTLGTRLVATAGVLDSAAFRSERAR